jgi:hypothetical protein
MGKTCLLYIEQLYITFAAHVIKNPLSLLNLDFSF